MTRCSTGSYSRIPNTSPSSHPLPTLGTRAHGSKRTRSTSGLHKSLESFGTSSRDQNESAAESFEYSPLEGRGSHRMRKVRL